MQTQIHWISDQIWSSKHFISTGVDKSGTRPPSISRLYMQGFSFSFTVAQWTSRFSGLLICFTFFFSHHSSSKKTSTPYWLLQNKPFDLIGYIEHNTSCFIFFWCKAHYTLHYTLDPRMWFGCFLLDIQISLNGFQTIFPDMETVTKLSKILYNAAQNYNINAIAPQAYN